MIIFAPCWCLPHQMGDRLYDLCGELQIKSACVNIEKYYLIEIKFPVWDNSLVPVQGQDSGIWMDRVKFRLS